MLNFGARYNYGTLNHSDLVRDRRSAIKSQFYADFEAPLVAESSPIVQLSDAIGDSKLTETMRLFLGAIKGYHVRPCVATVILT